MRIWYNKMGQSKGAAFEVRGDQVRIGRGAGNDIVLQSPYVAEQAAILSRAGANWELIPLGENDIIVSGRPLHPGERALIATDQPIQIYPFSLHLDSPLDEDLSSESLRRELDRQMSQLILEVHRELLSRMDLSTGSDIRRDNEEFLLSMEQDLEEIARLHGFLRPESAGLLTHFAAGTVQGHLVGGIVESAGQASEIWKSNGRWMRLYTAVHDFERELDGLVSRVSDRLGLPKVEDISRKIDLVEQEFEPIWTDTAPKLHEDVKQYLGLRYLKKQIKDIVFGYGPLEDLLRLPHISEIMVVDSSRIYIEKNGVLEKSGRRFVSDDVTISIIERIVSRIGRRIDKSQPLVDARLMDGSRVNAVIPPLAISGPCLTIRKFPSRQLRVLDLVKKGSLTPTVAKFLEAAVISRKNILISGGTGSGKTTLLNCLSDFIPDKERIVTIEDTAELQLQKDHVVRMETKSANVEGAGEYTIRDLVRNSLRMRPDRIVVGECRGAEALDMLQAMNTGHDGSMTTIHANNAEDVILRLEVLVQMAADLPIHSIHRQVASAIDLVVQLSRMRDGSRRVTQITEFVDYDERERLIRTKEIFRLEGSEDSAVLTPTGALPTFMGHLIESKLIDVDAFYL